MNRMRLTLLDQSFGSLVAITLVGGILFADDRSIAADFSYSFQTDTGYVGQGTFSYDAATAPPVIIESGSGPTATLQSLSLSVFDQSSILLDSGTAISGGVSSDSYLGFQFTTATLALSLMDNSTRLLGQDVSYFISNFVDPSNTPVTPGSTTFNLFRATDSTSTATYLGSTATISVTMVPEPAAVATVGVILGLAWVRCWPRQSRRVSPKPPA